MGKGVEKESWNIQTEENMMGNGRMTSGMDRVRWYTQKCPVIQLKRQADNSQRKRNTMAADFKDKSLGEVSWHMLMEARMMENENKEKEQVMV